MLKLDGLKSVAFGRRGPFWLYGQGVDEPTCTRRLVKVYGHGEQGHLAGAQKEYELFDELSELGCLLPCVRWHRGKGQAALVFDLSDRVSLRQSLPIGGSDTAAFLNIARAICVALAGLHKQGRFLGYVTPDDIFLTPDQREACFASLYFSNPSSNTAAISEALCQDSQAAVYLTPELTGRTELPVGLHTDLYSLGVIFFEVLGGQPPFVAAFFEDIPYAHIAIAAPVLAEIKAGVPVMVSEIVQKLLQKDPFERYQSIFGVLSDLRRALALLGSDGSIKPFPLAEKDVPVRLNFGTKLVGRGLECKDLLDNQRHTRDGEKCLSLVSGVAGVGKSALVDGVLERFRGQGAFVLATKFDPRGGAIPLQIFSEILSGLIEQLLRKPAQKQAEMKKRISQSLGANLGVVAQVVPNLRALISNIPEGTQLPPSESFNRLYHIFAEFMRLFGSPEEPIVIFADDVQWADQESLRLMERFLTRVSAQSVHLILAFRSEEVGPEHPLTALIDRVRQEPILRTEVQLSALKREDVEHWLSECLPGIQPDLKALTDLLIGKTIGNPFFMRYVLMHMQQKGLLEFDLDQGRWILRSDRDQLIPISSQVIELIIHRLKSSSDEVIEVLAYGASMGRQFDLKAVAWLLDKPGEVLMPVLEKILRGGFCRRVDKPGPTEGAETETMPEGIFLEFVHDRVREGVFALIGEQECQRLSWLIGTKLYREADGPVGHGGVFYIARYLNFGRRCALTPEDRTLLMKVNYEAALKARQASDFSQAGELINHCLDVLEGQDFAALEIDALWVYNIALEMSWLNGDFERARVCFDAALARATDVVDMLPAYENMGQSLIAQGRPKAAIDLAITFLRRLGVGINLNPSEADNRETIKAVVGLFRSSAHNETEGPCRLEDRVLLVVMHILGRFAAAVYLGWAEIFVEWIGLAVRISLTKGESVPSGYMYAAMAAILNNVDQIEEGHQFAQRAVNLLKHFDDPIYRGRTMESVYAHSWHYKNPLHECLTPLHEAYHIALKSGDFEYATWNAVFYSVSKFYTDAPLQSLSDELARLNESLKSLGAETGPRLQGMAWQMVLCLTSKSERPWVLDGQGFDEQEIDRFFKPQGASMALAVYHLFSAQLCYLFDRIDEARGHIKAAEPHKDALVAMIMLPEFVFYQSLIDLQQGQGPLQTDAEEYILSNISRLKRFANFCPENHLHRTLLLEAELGARQAQEMKGVLSLYQGAIQGATENGFTADLALAYRRLAGYWQAQGNEAVAALYLEKCLTEYGNWGGHTLIEHLTARHPKMASRIAQQMEKDKLAKSKQLLSVLKGLTASVDMKVLQAQMMRLLLEYSGASKCAFLLKEAGGIKLKAMGTHTPALIKTDLDRHAAGSGEVPYDLIYEVGETGREVLYNHVQRDAPYTADPYLSLHRPKSVLCLPIQFSDTRMGFLYLENKHLAGAFTVNHMDFIRSMAAHIIVGLENAMLYTRLFESERLLKTSQQIAHVGSWQYDIARDHLVWSDEVFNIFGIERDQFDGTFSSFSSMVHPEDAAQIERVMNNFDVIKKRGERLVHRIIRPSGEVRWLEEKFEVFHEGGKAVRTLGMVLDITEQKMAEEQLRVSENKYRHLYESIDDAFVLTDVSGAILQSNKAFQEMVQYTPSDLAQMNLKDLTPERWHGLDEEIVKKRLLPEGRADLYEKELICKDGALLPVELQLFYVRLNGDKRGFIGAIIRDISKRRVYEHVLVQARLAAERASRAKSDFIAHVSHELKTPLNGVLGFAQILVASERDDKRKKHLETIRDSGKHLLNIIDNILDLTRLEAGALPVQFKPLEVETLVNEVEAILGDMIRGKGLEFNIDVDVKKDRFWGDWVKIKQILINLIGNAMKFTAQGRISLKARLEPGSTPGVSRLAFSVTDTGVGMTSDQQKHLFAKFSNFGTVVQGKIASGTGLGLAIVKNLVDLIGGQIEVESVVGRGTEVKVLLPVKNSEPEGPSDLGGGEAMGRVSSLFRPELKGKKVLVAEDSEVNQAFMEVLLSEIGVTCDMASNGQEAAERVKSDSYDLILMDIQMPVMNGYEAASSIRKSGAALPIVALTAYSDVENKEKAQANGMNDFLAKPVDIASLVKVLKKWALGST